MIDTEKTSSVVVHIDEVVGKGGLSIKIYKRTFWGMVDLPVFFVPNTRNPT
jgi:hypothetical protein